MSAIDQPATRSTRLRILKIAHLFPLVYQNCVHFALFRTTSTYLSRKILFLQRPLNTPPPPSKFSKRECRVRAQFVGSNYPPPISPPATHLPNARETDPIPFIEQKRM